jgi:hypothetical protein
MRSSLSTTRRRLTLPSHHSVSHRHEVMVSAGFLSLIAMLLVRWWAPALAVLVMLCGGFANTVVGTYVITRTRPEVVSAMIIPPVGFGRT